MVIRVIPFYSAVSAYILKMTSGACFLQAWRQLRQLFASSHLLWKSQFLSLLHVPPAGGVHRKSGRHSQKLHASHHKNVGSSFKKTFPLPLLFIAAVWLFGQELRASFPPSPWKVISFSLPLLKSSLLFTRGVMLLTCNTAILANNSALFGAVDGSLPLSDTHHFSVGDLGQQVCQVVPTEPLVVVVQLQAANSCSHAARGDHRRRVHGKTVICGRNKNNAQLVKQPLQVAAMNRNHIFNYNRSSIRSGVCRMPGRWKRLNRLRCAYFTQSILIFPQPGHQQK